MMWTSLECFLILAIATPFLATAQPFEHLFRDQDEGSVYNGEFSIKSGIVKSGFENSVSISMQMIVQPYDNQTVFVRIDQRNGTAKSENVNREKKTPKEELFLLPSGIEVIHNLDTFEFLLKSEGKMILRKDAKDLNMMKAIASVLIFDWDTINKQKKKSFQYTNRQDTLYGSCRMMSFAKTRKDDCLFVEQNFDPMDCGGELDWRLLTDNHEVYTLKGIQMSNSRKYEFSKRADKYLMKELHTQQHIFHTPGKSDDIEHFLHTFYDFQLNEEAEISAQKFQEDLFDWETLHDFKFASLEKKSLRNHDFSDFMSIPRKKEDEMKIEMKRLLRRVQQLKDPSEGYGVRWEVVEIVDYMKTFSEEDFSQIYHMTVQVNESDPDMTRNFFQVLPLVGSPASTIFSAKMISSPKAEFNREKMLVKLAESIRQVSGESLDILKNLTRKDSPLAYLLYSRALTVIPEKKSDIFEISEMSEDRMDTHWQERLEFFSERFSSAKNYEEKRILLESIGNLQEFRLSSLLLRIIQEEDENLKIHAMYALQKSYSRFSESLYKSLISYAIDQELSTEVRAVAVKIILNLLNKLASDSQRMHFESLARRLHDDPDHELYNFFATTTKTLTTRGILDISAEKFLKRLEPGARSRGFFFKTHGDFEVDFSITGHLIFDKVTKGLRQIQVDLLQSSHQKFSILLRASDVDFITKLNDIQTNLFFQPNFKYELSLAKSAMTIFSRTYKCDFQSIVESVLGVIHTLPQFTTKEWSGKEILSLTNSDYFIPTDAGRRLRIFTQTPLFFSGKFAFSDGDQKGVIFSVNTTLQSVRGMEVLQPNLRAFQGTRQMSSLTFSRQFAIDFINLRHPERFWIFQFSKNNAVTPLLGLWNVKETQLYFNRLNEAEMPKMNFVPVVTDVTDGHEFSSINREVLAKGDCEDLGISYSFEIIGYKAAPNDRDLPKSLSEIMYQKPFSGMLTMSKGDFLVSFMSYIRRNFLIPRAYGVNWKALLKPSDTFDTSKITLKLKNEGFFFEFTDKEDNVRVTYVIATRHDNDYSIARIPAEGPSTGLCFSFATVWREMPEWNAKIFYGTYHGKTLKCPKDQARVLIEGSSKFTGEQIEHHSPKHMTYSQCRPEGEILPEDAENSYTCAKAATMLRDVMIWVHYKNLPLRTESRLRSWATWFFANSGGIHEAKDADLRSPGEIQIGIYRPMHSEDYEMTVYMPEDSYTFKGSSKLLWMENSAFQGVDVMTEDLFIFPICRIRSEDLSNSNWTIVADINSETYIYASKHGKDQLSMKVQYRQQEITISPRDDLKGKYNVLLNEEDVDMMPLHYKRDRMSMITIGDTVFFLNNFLWNRFIPTIGYDSRSIFIKGLLSGSHRGICFGDKGDKFSLF